MRPSLSSLGNLFLPATSEEANSHAHIPLLNILPVFPLSCYCTRKQENQREKWEQVMPTVTNAHKHEPVLRRLLGGEVARLV